MIRKPRMSQRPNGLQGKLNKPSHWPHHHHDWYWDDWYWDDWYWDDWYWDDDYYYMVPQPKAAPGPNPTPKPKSAGKPRNYNGGCDWSNTLAYQAGYNDGFMAGVDYANQETIVTPTPEPTPTPPME